MKDFTYVEPDSLEEACAFLASHGEDTKVLSGGCSLTILLKHGLIEPSYVLGLKRLSALRSASHENGVLTLGAGVTHRTIELWGNDSWFPPVLRQMAASIGQVQVRNFGTIGGNLCHAESRSDPPAVLAALDATVTIQSVRGARSVPVEELITDYYTTQLEPDEILTEIRIPDLPAGARCEYLKLTPHSSMAEPMALVATVLVPGDRGGIKELRLALGAVSPAPVRLRGAEELVQKEGLGDAVIERVAAMAAQESRPLHDSAGPPDWKREVVRVHVARVLKRMREN